MSRWTLASCAILSSIIISCMSEGVSTTSGGGGQVVSLFLDASMYLLFLPSLMSVSGLDKLARATETFLAYHFHLSETPLESLHVLVSSQTLMDGRDQEVAMGNATYFLVEAKMQIVIRCLDSASEEDHHGDCNTIEDLVQSFFADDWDGLRGTLELLDSTLFEELQYLEVLTRKFESSHSSSGNEGEEQPPRTDYQVHPRPNWLPMVLVYAVIGFAVIGVLVALLLTACGGIFTTQYPKEGWSVRQTTVGSSSASSSEVIPSKPQDFRRRPVGHSRMEAQGDSCSSRREMDAGEMPSPSMIPQRGPPPTLKPAPSEIFVLSLSNGGESTGNIQRIFSQDKVLYHHSTRTRQHATHHETPSSTMMIGSHGTRQRHYSPADDNVRGNEGLKGILRPRSIITKDDNKIPTREDKEHRSVKSKIAIVNDSKEKKNNILSNARTRATTTTTPFKQWGVCCKKSQKADTLPCRVVDALKEVREGPRHEEQDLVEVVDMTNHMVPFSQSSIPPNSHSFAFHSPISSNSKDLEDGCYSMSTMSRCDSTTRSVQVSDNEDTNLWMGNWYSMDSSMNDDDVDDDDDGGDTCIHANTTFRIGSDTDEFGSIAHSLPSFFENDGESSNEL